MKFLTTEKPFVIPIFIPHKGCRGRCVFCNQTVITETRFPEDKDIFLGNRELRVKIRAFLKYKGPGRGPTQIAFFGGNFLGLKEDVITRLLEQASRFTETGIRFSTRPDTITPEKLDLIRPYPISVIELGVQSMDDTVLELSRRGHTAQDTVRAVRLLNAREYQTGLQIMVGLPGDDGSAALATAQKAAELSPDCVRIYPTLVIAGSPLAKWYKSGKYKPLELDECVTLVKQIFLIFKDRNIPVIRMGLQSSRELETPGNILAGPYHPAFGFMVYSEILLDRVIQAIEEKQEARPYTEHQTTKHQTPKHQTPNTKHPNTRHQTPNTQTPNTQTPNNQTPNNQTTNPLTIIIHPRKVSELRGLKNRNIRILKERFHVKEIKIIQDPLMGKDDFEVFFTLAPDFITL